ncbi:hypothetical protein AB0K48_59185 [Nonomuraea sp. NPDC055795]
MDIFLFLAALVLITLISNLSGSVAKQRLKVAGATLSQAGHRLTHYELAYLAGGPRRAIVDRAVPPLIPMVSAISGSERSK